MASRPATIRATTAAAPPSGAGRGLMGAENGLGEILARIQFDRPDLSRAWFVRLRGDEIEGGVLRILAENRDQLRYLHERCAPAFQEAAQAVTGRLVTVVFECAPMSVSPPTDVQAVAGSRQGDETCTLESFVVGPGNAFAHAAALAVVQAPGRSYNPLFLYGAAGTGKTHLLRAIARGLTDSGAGSGEYVSARLWTNDLMTSLERESADAFRLRYRSVGALVVDDVHEMAGCDYSQEELFAVVNSLLSSQRQVVVSATCGPTELRGIAERLTSRFASGLVAQLDQPTMETRVAILRRQASLRAVEVADEVVRFLVENVAGCCDELVSALVRTDSLARLAGSPLTIGFAEQAIGAPVQKAGNHGGTSIAALHGGREAKRPLV